MNTLFFPFPPVKETIPEVVDNNCKLPMKLNHVNNLVAFVWVFNNEIMVIFFIYLLLFLQKKEEELPVKVKRDAQYIVNFVTFCTQFVAYRKLCFSLMCFCFVS